MNAIVLKPQPTRRVKAWLDENAVFDIVDDRYRIAYTGRDDLVPLDVKRWIESWRRGGTPLNT